MYPESTVMFSLSTNEYVFQAEEVQINYILLATLTCQQQAFVLFVPIFLRVTVSNCASLKADSFLHIFRFHYIKENKPKLMGESVKLWFLIRPQHATLKSTIHRMN